MSTKFSCWLKCLVGLMEQNPRLAMLGAAIDRGDDRLNYHIVFNIPR